MRTGPTFKKSTQDPHLTAGLTYVSVFPRGNAVEIGILARIDAKKKSHTTQMFTGQSPILVEEQAWIQACKENSLP
jgi:hypothetical protein